MRITEEEPLNISYADLSDDDFQKFVSVGQPFKNPQYEPSDLISLASTKSLTIQGNRSLRQEASEQLAQLSLAFYEVFKKPLVVMSAYRSYTYQKNQIAESCKQSGYCAREGESEHQLGLTVDLWEATNEEKFLAKYQAEYDRLVGNAWKWGFHQSYQKGKSVDGYAVEPWHWRYLREDLAKILWEKGMTFSELVRGK
ncbi:MAG: D-alanyl-D-alanine carboxypeptidase family protein [Candidatus Peribacteria bacterium]|nr:D-alanyl-D-alanine carboxypeptidase family protein [Candidatus Peribacteria bacterium]